MPKIRIIHCVDEGELHCHDNGQLSRQPTYITLDLHERTLEASYSVAVPMAVCHGFQRRYEIPLLTGSAANRAMAKIAPRAETILNDWEEEWDGHNYVARLGDAALIAEQSVRAMLSSENFPDHDLVVEVDASDLIDDENQDTYGITADTTDHRLDEIAADILTKLSAASSSGTAVCHGLPRYLRDIRNGTLAPVDNRTVTWFVVRGESPTSHAIEPWATDVDIPDDVLSWAEEHGVHPDEPDYYVLAAPADEAGEVVGEIARMTTLLDRDQVKAIRRDLATGN